MTHTVAIDSSQLNDNNIRTVLDSKMTRGPKSMTRANVFLIISLLAIFHFLPQLYYVNNNDDDDHNNNSPPLWHSPIQFADAKGVAGLGKAGGDGQGGSDKAGQQVPPEVYKALTYAGSLFLLTLSVPLILYGLNKLLNKIEDCFGCGPSSAKAKADQQQQAKIQNSFQQPAANSSLSNGNGRPTFQDKQPTLNNKNHLYQNQKYHLQLMHQQPKFYNYTPMEFAGDHAQNASNLADKQLQVNHLDQNHTPSPSTNQPIIKPFAKNTMNESCATTTNPSTHRIDQKRTSPMECLSDEVGLLNQQQLDLSQTQQQRAFTISSPHL